MAFKKDKLYNGFTGSYHRITQLNQNFDRNDAVMTIAVYKDKATRDENHLTTLTSFSYDLAAAWHNKDYSNGEDVMRSITLKEAYRVLKSLAITEEAKEDKNEDLAFFHNASDV